MGRHLQNCESIGNMHALFWMIVFTAIVLNVSADKEQVENTTGNNTRNVKDQPENPKFSTFVGKIEKISKPKPQPRERSDNGMKEEDSVGIGFYGIPIAYQTVYPSYYPAYYPRYYRRPYLGYGMRPFGVGYWSYSSWPAYRSG